MNIYQYLSYMYIVYIHNRPIRPKIKKKKKAQANFRDRYRVPGKERQF